MSAAPAGRTLLLLLAGLAATAVAIIPLDAVIYDVTPYRVGMDGSARITIAGHGFYRDGVDGATTVYIGALVCNTIEYYSSDTQIVCDTPAFSQPVNHPLAISLISYTAAVFARCDGSCPVLAPRWDFTPYVQAMTFGATVGDVLSFTGQLRAYAASELSVFVGGVRCPLVLPSDAVIAPNSWSTVTAQCTLPDVVAGRYNLTVVQNSASVAGGRAHPTAAALRAAEADGTVFMFTVVPALTAVPVHATGVLGGQLLTLTGSGFDGDAATCRNSTQVTLAGLPADIVACSPTQLTVRVPAMEGPNGTVALDAAASAAVNVTGGATGLRGRLWMQSGTGTTLLRTLANSSYSPAVPPAIVFNQLNGSMGYQTVDVLDNYFQVLDGYFVPPTTTNYTFYLMCDDWAQLELSSDERAANLRSVALCPQYSARTYYAFPQQISARVWLEAGRRYAVRLAHVEYWGGDFVQAGVRVHGSGDASQRPQTQYLALRERQQLDFTTTVVREEQNITFRGFASGLFRLTHPTRGASATVNLSKTDLTEFNAAVQVVLPCSSFSTWRYVLANGTVQYRVRINCAVAGAWTKFNVLNAALVLAPNATLATSGISVVTAVAASAPLGGSYRLGYQGAWTTPLALTASNTDVYSAIMALGSPDIADVQVTSSGSGTDSYTLYFYFANDPGNKATFTVDTNYTTGTNVSATVRVIEDGSLDHFLDPIPASYFQLPLSAGPQAAVTVNGVRATCPPGITQNDACSFSYNAALTPIVTAIATSLHANMAAPGSLVYLTGSGFVPDDLTVSIEIGGAPCTAVSVTATSLTCEVGNSEAGAHLPHVVFATVGTARLADDLVDTPILVTLFVTSVVPAAGSVAGGGVLQLTGMGFATDVERNNILIGGQLCSNVQRIDGGLSCVVPPSTHWDLENTFHPRDNSHVTVPIVMEVYRVSADGNSMVLAFSQLAGTAYTYAWDLTPLAATVTPAVFSSGISTRVTITGVFSLEQVKLYEWTTTTTTTTTPTSGEASTAEYITSELTTVEPTTTGSPTTVSPTTASPVTVSPTSTTADAGGTTTAAPLTLIDWTVNVTVAGRPCRKPVVTETSITCVVSRGEPADDQEPHAPIVTVTTSDGATYTAHADPTARVASVLSVLGQSVSVIGTSGGAELTLTGAGFHTLTERMTVLLPGGNDCIVTATNFTSVTCVTMPLPNITVVGGEILVSVNGVEAPCLESPDFDFNYNSTNMTGPCTLIQLASMTPRLYSISPASGAPSGGHVLEIFGANFSSDARAFVGAAACPVMAIAADGSSLNCTAPSLAAGVYPVRVNMPSLGDAVALMPVRYTSSFRLGQLSATTGSFAGGLAVTLSGDGFSTVLANNNISVNGVRAHITASTRTQLSFIVPTHSTPNQQGTLLAAIAVNVSADALVPRAELVHLADLRADIYQLARLGTSDCTPTTRCGFTYNSSRTPTLTGLAPESGVRGTVLRLAGTGLNNTDLSVRIGGVTCAVLNRTNTVVYCTVGATPAGRHIVYVSSQLYGGAAYMGTSKRFLSLGSIASVEPAVLGGYGGGTIVTITGSGFGASTAGSNVTVCGAPCTVLSSSYDSLTCRSAPVNTPQSLAAFANVPATLLNMTSFSSSNTWAAKNAFDGDFASFYYSASTDVSTCVVGMDLGPSWRAVIDHVRFFPRYRDRLLMVGGVFEASVDGTTNWLLIGRVNAPLHEGWSMLMLEPTAPLASLPVRALRYRGPTGGSCKVTEIEFYGHLVRAAAVLPGVGDRCNITVNAAPISTEASLGPIKPGVFGAASSTSDNTLAAASINVTSQLEVRLAQTPVVTSVAPRFGSSLGGTIVTLTGSGLAGALDAVLVSGVPCALVGTPTDTEVQCVTGPRDAIREPSLVVPTPTGAAVVGTSVGLFRYLDRWSEPNTWLNDEMPVEGDSVVVPPGQTVLLDMSPPRLFLLLVQGMLVFDRQDLTLNASYIIALGGRIEIGTEAEPFLNKTTITLHGDRMTSVEVPNIGAKVLGVSSMKGWAPASLDIHGRPRQRVWTKLDVTAPAGTTHLVTAEPVDFEVGETVVVTSSSNDFTEAEELIVTARPDPRVIVVNRPLRFTHNTGFYTAPDGRIVDMRCEVGLLTRNIVIQGDDRSEAQRFGVHTIASGPSIYRVENAEFRHCGQAGVLGRYCTHMHMSGDMRLSYVKSNSVHHSFQRSTTIHGSHNALVQNNFAFHIMGHTFFVEDGNEAGNTFDGNLGAWTLKTFVMLESDTKPATFWMSSPRNMWRNNVAGGCTNDGYWFEPPGNPGGPSFTTAICPLHEHVLEFRNNTAHSNGVHGLRIYPSYFPLTDPCDISSPPLPQYFNDFVSFHNSGHGIFTKRGGDLHHVNASLIENGGEEFSWLKIDEIVFRPAVKENAHLQDVLMVASRTRTVNKRALFMPQLEYFHVSGATFVNYGDGGAISGCNECASDTEYKQDGYTYRLEGLSFVNTTRRTRWVAPYKQIFADLDGSLTGFPNGTALPYFAFNDHPACMHPNTTTWDGGHVCDGSVRVRRLQLDGIDPRELDFKLMNVTSAYGSATVGFRPKEFYGYALPLVADGDYTLKHVSTIDFQTMRFRYSEPEYVDTPDEHLLLHFPYIDYRYAFQVKYSNTSREIGTVNSLLNFTAASNFGVGSIHYDTQVWDIALTTHGVNLATASPRGPYDCNARALQCAPGACGVPNIVPLGPPRLWSQPSSWPNGQIPGNNGNLTIPAGVYMVLDLDASVMPRFQKCYIAGRLEFLDGADRRLICATIVVWGELAAGSVGSPFYGGSVTITLTGVRASPTLIVSDSVYLGNKVMAVYGSVVLHGDVPQPAWTRLATTAEAGDTQLTLVEPVSWAVGDRLAITPTEYNATEMETVTVAAVANEGTLITLTAPLQFRHYAGTVDDGRGGTITLAAAVGVLTRNIVFEGELGAEGTEAATYGAHIEVGDLDFGNQGGVRVGTSRFIGVEFRNNGKLASEHAGLTYRYFQQRTLAAAPANWVHGCSFSTSFNYGLVGVGAVGLSLRNNIFHRTFRSAVDLDANSHDAVITDNLVVGNYKSPDDPTDWVRPFAGFYLTGTVAALRGNVVGGGQDTGFTFRPPTCGTSDTLLNSVALGSGDEEPVPAGFGDNEAHGVLVGTHILPQGSGCVELTDFKAWKCAHLGVLTVDQTSNLDVLRTTVADSHIGMSFSFVRGNGAGLNTARVVSSFVLGSTPASSSSGAACSQSTDCRTLTGSDVAGTSCQSVFGRAFRRVGVVLPQYLNRAKTCEIDGGLEVCRPVTTPERLCSLPWEKRFGLPSTVRATMQFIDTTFAYFAESDCGRRSLALVPNPSQFEFVPEVFFSGMAWHEVGDTARMWFSRLPNLTSPMCEIGCDGLDQFVAHDLDGSVTGVAGNTLLSLENPPLSDPVRCQVANELGAFNCSSYALVPTTLDNIDMDRGGRRVGPIEITRTLVSGENRTAFSTGPDNDHCAMRFFFGQYPFALEPGHSYFVYTANTMPNNARLQFLSSNPTDAVVVRLFYTNPMQVDVFRGDTLVPRQATWPTLSSAAGANAFDPQAKSLIFVMRGGAALSDRVYTLRVKNVVALTLSISINLADFKAVQATQMVANLALLLSIPASRIRIVAVHPADQLDRRRAVPLANQTSIQIEIVDAVNGTVANDTAVEHQAAQFQSLLTTLEDVASNGTLLSTFNDLGLPIASLQVRPPAVLGTNASQPFVLAVLDGNSGGGDGDGDGGSSGASTGAVIGGAVGGAAGALLLVIVVVLVVRAHARHQQNGPTGAHDFEHQLELSEQHDGAPSPLNGKPVAMLHNPMYMSENSNGNSAYDEYARPGARKETFASLSLEMWELPGDRRASYV